MRIRYATPSDLGFVGQDEYLPADTVARKIEAREVIVAEDDSGLTGYARLDYLWSKVPYLALIRSCQIHGDEVWAARSFRF